LLLPKENHLFSEKLHSSKKINREGPELISENCDKKIGNFGEIGFREIAAIKKLTAKPIFKINFRHQRQKLENQSQQYNPSAIF
jgi:hypothetical protein